MSMPLLKSDVGSLRPDMSLMENHSKVLFQVGVRITLFTRKPDLLALFQRASANRRVQASKFLGQLITLRMDSCWHRL